MLSLHVDPGEIVPLTTKKTGAVPDDFSAASRDDLARNVAGAGVAAEAKALRDEAPVRTFLARLLGVHTDERAYRVGAKGESLVAAQLERLGPVWHVLHSIKLSETGTDLDHLVVGPAGVFCLNTKNHPDAKIWVAGDTLMVNGQRKHYVPASRNEGKKVSRLLTAACGFKVTVRPVVVLVNCGMPKVKGQPPDVRVCTRRGIVEWLRSQPLLLSSEEVETIFSAARRPTTWLSTLPAQMALTPTSDKSSDVPPRPPASITEARGSPSQPHADGPSGAGGRLVITRCKAEGLRLHGDPRPHQRILKEVGLRWDGRRGYWYVPGAGELDPGVVEGLAALLSGLGFQVEMDSSLEQI